MKNVEKKTYQKYQLYSICSQSPEVTYLLLPKKVYTITKSNKNTHHCKTNTFLALLRIKDRWFNAENENNLIILN